MRAPMPSKAWPATREADNKARAHRKAGGLVNHVFAKQRTFGAEWWHETAHADLEDAQGDAAELREGHQNAITRILRGEDSFAWVEAKLAQLNRVGP